ncbi:hypothetical protein THAOC_11724 [Thalassiosira oceanica]|uniref:Uncharacterized protein n=1 Tax=Thalassiosira oceanica TaxID=159749 RepID=K0T1Z7_THAOC|nr:hypothetical protein THAOC_11724 [Thalassiosira oceanica]|eukprot:EJK67271.1 hypothetical protein THAOC_11724 [Thalassiosira oceanica]
MRRLVKLSLEISQQQLMMINPFATSSVTREFCTEVTKPFVSQTGVAGRPNLGVPGKITGSVGSADLPGIITAVGPLILWGVFTTGSFGWDKMDFALLPEYFGGSFDREYAEKLFVEAFEEDTGLNVGSGVAENHEEEDQD